MSRLGEARRFPKPSEYGLAPGRGGRSPTVGGGSARADGGSVGHGPCAYSSCLPYVATPCHTVPCNLRSAKPPYYSELTDPCLKCKLKRSLLLRGFSFRLFFFSPSNVSFQRSEMFPSCGRAVRRSYCSSALAPQLTRSFLVSQADLVKSRKVSLNSLVSNDEKRHSDADTRNSCAALVFFPLLVSVLSSRMNGAIGIRPEKLRNSVPAKL